MIVDEKDFFRQATLRICSSLDNLTDNSGGTATVNLGFVQGN